MPLALIRIKLTVNFYKGNLTGKTILGVPKSIAAEVTVYKEYLFIYLMMNPQLKYKQQNP